MRLSRTITLYVTSSEELLTMSDQNQTASAESPSRDATLPPNGGSVSELHVPATIRQALYGLFLWCLLGIALAYGMRLWNDSPVHPSFIPLSELHSRQSYRSP